MKDDTKEAFEDFKKLQGEDFPCYIADPSDPWSNYLIAFEKGWEAYRQNLGVVPPIWKECPECNGTGQVPLQFSMMLDGICNRCIVPGKVPNYLTPEQYTAWMKEHVDPEWEMSDDMPIWCITPRRPIEMITYSMYLNIKTLAKALGDEIVSVVATEAGRPPEGWRPE